MSRSLKVNPQFIEKVKSALKRNSFPSQQALATELGISRDTVVKFLNGKSVDYLNFVEICRKLGLDWQAIALFQDAEIKDTANIQDVNPPKNQARMGNELVGKTVGGRYKIMKLLRKTEFSETYLAEHEYLPDKSQRVIKRYIGESGEISKQFMREVQVLSQLGDHPQIPTLFDSFKEDENFYLVEQLIEGDTLAKELVEGEAWHEEQVIAILEDILGILTFVHRSNIIHRHINPHNLIRRNTDNKLVLINFGSVKQLATLQERTFSGADAYIPPEQAIGRPKLSSDIYAVGIVGIQAITGLHPNKLEGDGTEITWRVQLQDNSELVEFLKKMVCSEYRQRYQSADEALVALKMFRST